MSTTEKRARREATATANKPDDELRAASFEAVMAELQSVVARLEEGDLSLEESLLAFEKGVQLSREGGRRLEDAERRVEALLASDAVATDESAPEPHA